MPIQKLFAGKLLPACSFLFAIFTGCSQSSISPENSTHAIIPGEDIQIVDAYFNSQNRVANLVIRNTRNYKLPSFTMDYSLVCDNGYKIYTSTYFSLSSNEQDSHSAVIGSNATSCTLTITAIRPSYQENYTDWTGSYPIQIQAQNTETTAE